MKITHIPEVANLPAKPADPDVGYNKLYKKTDGHWYELDSDGLEQVAFAMPIVFNERDIVTHIGTTVDERTEALVKDIPITTAGAWLFTLSFNYNADTTTADIAVFVNLDGGSVDLDDRSGTTEGLNQVLRVEVKDSNNDNAGTGPITNTGSAQKISYSAQFLLDNLTVGDKKLTIEVGGEIGNQEFSMWNITGVFTPCRTI